MWRRFSRGGLEHMLMEVVLAKVPRAAATIANVAALCTGPRLQRLLRLRIAASRQHRCRRRCCHRCRRCYCYGIHTAHSIPLECGHPRAPTSGGESGLTGEAAERHGRRQLPLLLEQRHHCGAAEGRFGERCMMYFRSTSSSTPEALRK